MSKRLSCHVGFNAQHSPMGAFMSFTCGHPGTKGGIGLQIGQPADQEVFVGVIDGDRYADAPLKSLPFYIGAVSKAAEAFTVEQAGPSEANVRPDAVAFRPEEIERRYGWCTDSWRAGELSFTVYTPFGPIPDPRKASAAKMRDGLRPAVVAHLVVDNTKGTKPRTGVFALNHSRPGPRMIAAGLGRKNRTGFAFRREAGVAAEVFDLTPKGKAPGPQPFGFMRWSATDGIRERHNPVHLLGSCPGVGFEVPPGRRYGMVLAIGSYLECPVTTGLDGRYLYTRYYEDLTDVLRSTLDRADALMAAAEALDAKLDAAGLSDDQRFMIAHATHSYYGSTQLLEIGRKPFWVVNEGEYCMMNTLDLAVDHVFWELDRNPWLVKNLLDNFARLYSYTDEIKVYEGEAALSSHAMDHDPSQPPPPPDAAQLARP
ncbi:MAG TPA: glycoside hydrolase family 52 protein, partial [Vicinamibacteria bacterium]|nr:glycoside hydrolase family 52 protein [Vicinamibacteria bacterium]